ncbi:glutamate-5-semialdehyde dehydrogenase [Nisaea nitritireducens]|uniref:glutamate-5-semialdehyde dehydrogenase n=1 Tax=Nisaea nitritireducens TaxID=568392 RepID=UPI0018660E80|nr:glutamate-5-semialdehyde dehydrogenase [Nisaea nitritireducens]
MAILEIDSTDNGDIAGMMSGLGAAAREASAALAVATTEQKNAALKGAAEAIRASLPQILEANAKDLDFANEKGVRESLMDRLKLDADRIEAIAQGMEDVAALPDPIGGVMAEWDRPNGLKIARVRVPLGVIGIIYESRPNVTADAGSLCLKSGNAAILRGGSESFHSSNALVECLHQGLKAAGLPEAAVQLIPTRDRAAVGALLTMNDTVDIIVPRGGKSLIERVQKESRIPVIAHLDGVCHVYVDAAADPDMARDIALNSKMRRTSVCGSAETLLIDKKVAAAQLPGIASALREAGCVLKGDAAARKIVPDMQEATEADWSTEYLDAILSIRVVDGVDAAIDHINGYGSHHTDSIVTGDAAAAARFTARVDSAIVLHNASTQFADGGEFGMGAEIGISTGKLHARGPVGAEQLTSFKYVVTGTGQTRP